MHELAINLKEYPIVKAMEGVCSVLDPRLISKINDEKWFHSESIITYAVKVAPPYQSDQFT